MMKFMRDWLSKAKAYQPPAPICSYARLKLGLASQCTVSPQALMADLGQGRGDSRDIIGGFQNYVEDVATTYFLQLVHPNTHKTCAIWNVECALFVLRLQMGTVSLSKIQTI